ncbi:MAG TPA: TVP38/TMEM64 family protein [Candidatus Limnocylindria bacterium]|nr:TVP38/TMEM64 family protein [Candidatus Limnocylindria bacterium]
MQETAGGQQKQKPLALRLLPLVLIVATAVAVWQSGLLDYVSLQQLAENREALREYVAGNLAIALFAFIGVYAAVVALSLPIAAPLTLTGGFLFGWLAGGLSTVVAATLGAVIIFLLARTALADTFARKAGPLLGKFRKGFQENAISYLLFLRLVPLFPFWVVNLAPALLGVRLRDYVIATFIGIIPGAFAFALTGAGLDSVLVAQKEAYDQCVAQNSADNCAFDLDPAHLITTELLIAFAALGVVALIPVFAKRFWKNKPEICNGK